MTSYIISGKMINLYQFEQADHEMENVILMVGSRMVTPLHIVCQNKPDKNLKLTYFTNKPLYMVF